MQYIKQYKWRYNFQMSFFCFVWKLKSDFAVSLSMLTGIHLSSSGTSVYPPLGISVKCWALGSIISFSKHHGMPETVKQSWNYHTLVLMFEWRKKHLNVVMLLSIWLVCSVMLSLLYHDFWVNMSKMLIM